MTARLGRTTSAARRFAPALGAILAGLVLVASADAATIVVPPGDVAALIRAIENANSEAGPFVGPDTIELASGSTYTLTETVGERSLLPLVTSDITIDGHGATIERDPSLECTEPEPIDGVLPRLPADASILAVNSGARLELNTVTLRGACSQFNGGAVHNGRDGTLSIIGSTLSDNRLIGGFVGGAVYNEGRLTVDRSTFADNRAHDGGAILSGEESTLAIRRSTFVRNQATFGGAIYVVNPLHAPIIIESILTDNVAGEQERAGGGSGGAIYHFTSGLGFPPTIVVGSTLARNQGGLGGAIFATNADIKDSTLADNRAVHGGGVSAFKALTVSNSTIAQNHADRGGGIFLSPDPLLSSEFHLLNVTLGGNEAVVGGGIHTLGGGEVTLLNTLLANTIGGNCAGPRPISLGHNLATDGSCDLTGPGDLSDMRRPGLGPFVDDGEPGRGHFPLLVTSPAIDAGDGTECHARGITGDQLGQLRTDPCDIGAIELPLARLIRDLLERTGAQLGPRFFRFLRPVEPLILLAARNQGHGNRKNEHAAIQLVRAGREHVEAYANALREAINTGQVDPKVAVELLALAVRVLVELDLQTQWLSGLQTPPNDGQPGQ